MADNDWKSKLQDKADLVQRALANDTGQAFLVMLEDTFQGGRLYDESATKMAYNVGQHELVEYLKGMLKVANNG